MSKKSKRKNNLKSSVILLLLLLLLLISSTYAWFTANQVVTISTLDVHIEAQNGLQISTDAVNWKSIISNEDITTNAYSGHKNQVPTQLEPVSTVGEIDSSTGFMKMYYGTVAADDDDGGVDKLTATLETTEAAGSTGKYIAFDMFLKVEKETTLQLTDASSVVMKTGSTDKGIKQASRVAFCIEGTEATGTATSTITGLKGAVSFLEGGKTVYMWEPNANLHTAAAAAHANSNYGIANLATDGSATPVTYYGIKQEIGTGLTLKGTNDGTDTTNFAQITPDYQTITNTETGEMAVQDVFTLQAGITKIRVYMWIEGQDVDCENTASGTDISFNVQLQVKA